MSKPAPAARNAFDRGKVIGGYEIAFLIGLGGFGEVYKVTDKKTHQMFAMKTESVDAPKKALQLEIDCLNEVQGEEFPRLRAHGTEKKVNYLVMNMYGASIGSSRRQKGKFPPFIAIQIARQMLVIVQKFHEYGWIHRDVKPSNFLLQQHSSSPLVLIDFGLCKRHLDPETKEPLPEAPSAKFTGTKKYASMRAHNGKDLARCDDVMSWFYSVVEIWQGNLPWTEIAESKKMCTAKEEMDIEVLCDGMPHKFVDIWNMIKDLEYADKPDYDGIIAIIDEIVTEVGGGPVDWNALYAANSNLGDLRKSMTAPPSARSVQSGDAKQEAPGEGHGEGKCCEVQ